MAETATRKVVREACADTLGLLLQVTVDAKIDTDTYTINALADVSPDPERMRDSFLYSPVELEFRRILNFGYPTTNNVDISRAYTHDLGAATAAQIYFMLTPAEWDSVINEVLPEFYYIDRLTVVPIAGTTEYSLATATWLQTKGQVLNVFFEHKTTKIPEAVGSYEFTEAANVLKLILHVYPPSADTYNLVVEARHNYGTLATDVATTTCPRDLWFNAVQVGGLHRIFKKYGTNIKRLFGQAVMIAERDLAAAKARSLPPLVSRQYHIDMAWSGPDFGFLPEEAAW